MILFYKKGVMILRRGLWSYYKEGVMILYKWSYYKEERGYDPIIKKGVSILL